MKTLIHHLPHLAMAAFLVPAIISPSCNKLPSDNAQGYLCWNFSSGIPTRAILEIPDTDAFILKVANSAQEVLYEGLYGDSPESMLVNPGTYTISAVSRVFEAPEFEAPQFGDEQVAVVKAGEVTRVSLECSQLNCGLRLRIDSDFPSAYPGGHLAVSSEEGNLDYGVPEERTGFFKPGNLSLYLKDGSGSTRLLTRNLQAKEILTIGVTCPSGDSSSQSAALSIAVDTLRTWLNTSYEMGTDGDAGVTAESAYSVSQAKAHIGEKGVWVCGYIVGGDLSSSQNGIKFEAPFDSYTNIAIAARSSVSEKSSCMSVQLAKGSLRNALNLVDNPGLLGKKVYLRGDIETAYYGIPGIKNITEYSFD